MLGEVKARLSPTEVDRFLENADALRPSLAPADVRVCFFGFQCNPKAREKLHAAGAFMVCSNGRLL